MPVAEQVVEAPKIILENIPSRRSAREPQLAEQLVDVPTLSTALVLAPRVEDQLVEVPPIVPHVVPQSFFAGADGYGWAQISGPVGSTGGGLAPPTHSGPLPPPPPPPLPPGHTTKVRAG